MTGEIELQEYLDEIRREVCSNCVERPEGGPPCGPLGKPCGVELHLPQLVAAVHEVHSGLIEPYLACNRKAVCTTCPFLHSDHCPCPMDTLAVLVVEAVEAVDRRRAGRGPGHLAEVVRDLTPGGPWPLTDYDSGPEGEAIAREFEDATGTWTGCDWPTAFGPRGRDLEGWTPALAERAAAEAKRPEEAEDWRAAARWLAQVEERARRAEAEAARAVEDALAGEWDAAVTHARRAWLHEFSTGRPLRGRLPTWRRLYLAVEAAARPHLHPDTRIQTSLKVCS
jgi:hypothetical protein